MINPVTYLLWDGDFNVGISSSFGKKFQCSCFDFGFEALVRAIFQDHDAAAVSV